MKLNNELAGEIGKSIYERSLCTTTVTQYFSDRQR
jgi:hypothetical protein